MQTSLTSEIIFLTCVIIRQKYVFINFNANKLFLKMQANVSGYFFRCPTCNNSKDFIEEMSTHGIFIPQR